MHYPSEISIVFDQGKAYDRGMEKEKEDDPIEDEEFFEEMAREIESEVEESAENRHYLETWGITINPGKLTEDRRWKNKWRQVKQSTGLHAAARRARRQRT